MARVSLHRLLMLSAVTLLLLSLVAVRGARAQDDDAAADADGDISARALCRGTYLLANNASDAVTVHYTFSPRTQRPHFHSIELAAAGGEAIVHNAHGKAVRVYVDGDEVASAQTAGESRCLSVLPVCSGRYLVYNPTERDLAFDYVLSTPQGELTGTLTAPADNSVELTTTNDAAGRAELLRVMIDGELEDKKKGVATQCSGGDESLRNLPFVRYRPLVKPELDPAAPLARPERERLLITPAPTPATPTANSAYDDEVDAAFVRFNATPPGVYFRFEDPDQEYEGVVRDYVGSTVMYEHAPQSVNLQSSAAPGNSVGSRSIDIGPSATNGANTLTSFDQNLYDYAPYMSIEAWVEIDAAAASIDHVATVAAQWSNTAVDRVPTLSQCLFVNAGAPDDGQTATATLECPDGLYPSVTTATYADDLSSSVSPTPTQTCTGATHAGECTLASVDAEVSGVCSFPPASTCTLNVDDATMGYTSAGCNATFERQLYVEYDCTLPGGRNDRSWALVWRAESQKFEFWVQSREGPYYVAESAMAVAAGSGWHHVVGAFGGKHLSVYVDGVRGTLTDFVGHLSSGGRSRLVGAMADGMWRNWNGKIDSYAEYNFELTEGEVVAHYEADPSAYTFTIEVNNPRRFHAFEETASTMPAVDVMGRHNATYTPSLTVGDASTMWDQGLALQFTGTAGEFVQLYGRSDAELQAAMREQGYCVQAWLRPDATPMTGREWIVWENGNSEQQLRYDPDAMAVTFQVGTSSISSTREMNANDWHLVTACVTPSELQLFVWQNRFLVMDESAAVTSDFAGITNPATHACSHIGAGCYEPFWTNFNGNIDSLAVYVGGSFTKDEVETIARAAYLSVSTAQPVHVHHPRDVDTSASSYVACFDVHPTPGTVEGNMDESICRAQCASSGTRYFGISGGNRCACLDAFGHAGSAADAMCEASTCVGSGSASGDRCGGAAKQAVYAYATDDGIDVATAYQTALDRCAAYNMVLCEVPRQLCDDFGGDLRYAQCDQSTQSSGCADALQPLETRYVGIRVANDDAPLFTAITNDGTCNVSDVSELAGGVIEDSLCCNRRAPSPATPPPQWNDARWYSAPEVDWAASEAFCASHSRVLCDTSDICSGGEPWDGMRGRDAYAAVSTSNTWVSLGAYETCMTQSGQDWMTSSEQWALEKRRDVYCCPPPTPPPSPYYGGPGPSPTPDDMYPFRR